MNFLWNLQLGMVTVSLIGLLFVSQPRAILAERRAAYYEKEYNALCVQNHRQRMEIANIRGYPKHHYAILKEK